MIYPAAVMQVLQGKWDRTFSITATGFARTLGASGRGASAAVYRGRLSLVCGPGLGKFFDRFRMTTDVQIETRLAIEC